MLESKFQAALINELEQIFEGCFIIRTDPNYIQGFPDFLMLYKNKWAAFECKRRENSPQQPNQEYYISELDAMSFASFICPENKEEVLYELQRSFRLNR